MAADLAVFAARAGEVLPDSAGWLDDAAVEFESLRLRWDLHDVKPVTAGRGGVLLQAVSDGRRVAVKLPFFNAKAAAAVTCAYAAQGWAPTCFDTTETGWVLLEWVPSPTLDVAPSRINVVAAARRLVEASTCPPVAGIPLFAPFLQERLETDPVDVSAMSRRPTDSERETALVLLAELSDTVGLCHGDANGGNLIMSDRGVLVIDPRGYNGDAHADVAALWLKTGISSVMSCSAFAAEVRCDAERLEAWAAVIAASRI